MSFKNKRLNGTLLISSVPQGALGWVPCGKFVESFNSKNRKGIVQHSQRNSTVRKKFI
jgi:hypothetical protein